MRRMPYVAYTARVRGVSGCVYAHLRTLPDLCVNCPRSNMRGLQHRATALGRGFLCRFLCVPVG